MSQHLFVRPISIAAANEYVELNHRHHGKKTGCRFAICCIDVGGEIHGVAICSNPVARNNDDGLTLEVSRLCTDGTRNACSILYGAAARIAKDMGFRKIQTYILSSEDGASLRASGWQLEEDNVGSPGDWSDISKSERQMKRNRTPRQMSFFEDKKTPCENKKKYSRVFGN